MQPRASPLAEHCLPWVLQRSMLIANQLAGLARQLRDINRKQIEAKRQQQLEAQQQQPSAPQAVTSAEQSDTTSMVSVTTRQELSTSHVQLRTADNGDEDAGEVVPDQPVLSSKVERTINVGSAAGGSDSRSCCSWTRISWQMICLVVCFIAGLFVFVASCAYICTVFLFMLMGCTHCYVVASCVVGQLSSLA